MADYFIITVVNFGLVKIVSYCCRLLTPAKQVMLLVLIK